MRLGIKNFEALFQLKTILWFFCRSNLRLLSVHHLWGIWCTHIYYSYYSRCFPRWGSDPPKIVHFHLKEKYKCALSLPPVDIFLSGFAEQKRVNRVINKKTGIHFRDQPAWPPCFPNVAAEGAEWWSALLIQHGEVGLRLSSLNVFAERFWKERSWSQCFQLGSYSSFSCY